MKKYIALYESTYPSQPLANAGAYFAIITVLLLNISAAARPSTLFFENDYIAIFFLCRSKVRCNPCLSSKKQYNFGIIL